MADQVQPEVDLYDLSDEDFLKHMEAAQAAQGQTTVEADDRPRDAQGRFIAQEAVAETTEETEEVDEVVYRREIDLGDGSGKQVFEGGSYDELIDKLATAQEHASRKIRELTAAKKAVVEAVTEPSADEEWLMSQELLATPTKAIKKAFEQLVGKPLEAFKSDLQRVEVFERAQREKESAQQFLDAHPEYVANKHNGGLMQNYLQLYKMEGTPENIEQVYATLKTSGLLQLDIHATPEAYQEHLDNNPETPTRQRIAAPAGVKTVVVQKKAASGLSAKRSVSTPVQPTEQDLYDMPEKEFFKLGGVSQDNW